MMTIIREKYGLIGEMSFATFVTIVITLAGFVGGAYAFTYMSTSNISNKLSEHEVIQTKNQTDTATQLATLNAKMDILLKQIDKN